MKSMVLILVTLFAFSLHAETAAKKEAEAEGKKPAATPALIKKGKQIFKNTCMGCHASWDWKTYKFKQGAESNDIFKTITNGIGAMRPTTLSEEDRWAAIYYLETLRGKK